MTGVAGGAHLLLAGGAEAIPRVLALLEKEGIKTRGNPDVYVRAYDQFGVDEARELRERAAARAFGAHRVFVLAAPGMTTEAQNALLKTLEEPPGEAAFFFIVPAPEALLPTFRSRVQVADFVNQCIPRPQGIDPAVRNAPAHKRRALLVSSSSARKCESELSHFTRSTSLVNQSPRDLRNPVSISRFLSAAPKNRLDMLKPLLEKNEDDKRDQGAIIAFLSALEPELEKRPGSLRALYRARKYAGDKGALIKPLLEQVALLI